MYKYTNENYIWLVIFITALLTAFGLCTPSSLLFLPGTPLVHFIYYIFLVIKWELASYSMLNRKGHVVHLSIFFQCMDFYRNNFIDVLWFCDTTCLFPPKKSSHIPLAVLPRIPRGTCTPIWSTLYYQVLYEYLWYTDYGPVKRGQKGRRRTTYLYSYNVTCLKIFT